MPKLLHLPPYILLYTKILNLSFQNSNSTRSVQSSKKFLILQKKKREESLEDLVTFCSSQMLLSSSWHSVTSGSSKSLTWGSGHPTTQPGSLLQWIEPKPGPDPGVTLVCGFLCTSLDFNFFALFEKTLTEIRGIILKWLLLSAGCVWRSITITCCSVLTLTGCQTLIKAALSLSSSAEQASVAGPDRREIWMGSPQL